ncbi:uncharacterized protein ATNIH1004_002579 [Aspergillus tanneri]|uniref:Uncharacterized protein n=1 Tax=Aspergillus tanneri TaxID=1220188 RepID=A0A5M9MX31_9EURO|nr:uncharacterized protein ATNIH1004_002579 [Aspergillus tanneri]KAA8649900.1 hypothetical protein ATNIH1004_002579 [Aspergillus tanneri]
MRLNLYLASLGPLFRLWPSGKTVWPRGKYHVVGVSGAAARKIFLDNRDFDFVRGAALVGHGPDFVPPLHEIFHNNYQNGRSYFQRRLVDLQKSEQLAKRLPGVTRDARMAFEALGKNPSGVMNPTDACYRLVVQQACRVVCSGDLQQSKASRKVPERPVTADAYQQYTHSCASVSALNCQDEAPVGKIRAE